MWPSKSQWYRKGNYIFHIKCTWSLGDSPGKLFSTLLCAHWSRLVCFFISIKGWYGCSKKGRGEWMSHCLCFFPQHLGYHRHITSEDQKQYYVLCSKRKESWLRVRVEAFPLRNIWGVISNMLNYLLNSKKIFVYWKQNSYSK